MFAMINRLQAEKTQLKSELLAAERKLAIYQGAIGTEEEAQLAKQAAIIEGQANAITFEELTAGAPIDDDFTPEMKR